MLKLKQYSCYYTHIQLKFWYDATKITFDRIHDCETSKWILTCPVQNASFSAITLLIKHTPFFVVTLQFLWQMPFVYKHTSSPSIMRQLLRIMSFFMSITMLCRYKYTVAVTQVSGRMIFIADPMPWLAVVGRVKISSRRLQLFHTQWRKCQYVLSVIHRPKEIKRVFRFPFQNLEESRTGE